MLYNYPVLNQNQQVNIAFLFKTQVNKIIPRIM